MSAKKSKTFFKTLTAILVLLLFFGGYYIYSSGIFGASVTENISEHSITDEERLIEYEEYGITYDESSQSYLYQDSLIKNLRDGDFLYTNAAGSIKLIIQRDDNGHIQCVFSFHVPIGRLRPGGPPSLPSSCFLLHLRNPRPQGRAVDPAFDSGQRRFSECGRLPYGPDCRYRAAALLS